jgi:glycosyltransferase involved in cell wall biosynthesis
MNKKKVLYVSFDLVPSEKGASTHITNFIKEIAKKYSTTLITLGNENFSKEYFSANHIGIKINSPNFLERVQEFSKEVWKNILDEKYDVVHFRSIWEGIPICYLKNFLNFKTIYEVNGFPSIELKYHYPEVRKNKRFKEKLKMEEEYCLKNSDFIITPSNVTKKFINSFYKINQEKIKVIPNGVDINLFTPKKNLKEKEIIENILYVGTLAPWQGIDTLLEAFLLLLKNNYKVKLFILGTGRKKWREEYQKKIRKLKIENVYFLNPVSYESVPEIINNSDICVAPLSGVDRNLIQGCSPLKIFEYLSCKKPVVASEIECVREILEDKKDALLFEPDSPYLLFNCLKILIEDKNLRKSIQENGYKKIKKFYNWKNSLKQLLKIYKNI